ncbi:MAG TPA: ABC transporter ATP-binding protein [Actinomycetota bacterium]|nr:ABC transporter ATP-binding protein [Actinomycetota bacterium]
MTEALLSVRNLSTRFDTDDGVVRAVDEVSFDVMPREIFGIVGESGSGKSVTALSILGLLPKPAGRVAGGQVLYKGSDLLAMDPGELRKLRGNRITMIFQDPLTALNPVFTVGNQIAEVFRIHQGISKQAAARKSIDMLRLVGIPKPEQRADDYPHQFSGGMRQRAMIAMAVALDPDLLIADEPTTALDVTIQAQIIDVLLQVREECSMAIMLITHDLGVVAGVAERVMVMYAGKVAEIATVDEIFTSPKHPYTWGLMTSIARLDEARKARLIPIRGAPPSVMNEWTSCPFSPRCDYRQDVCDEKYPSLISVSDAHDAACHFARDSGWAPRVGAQP